MKDRHFYFLIFLPFIFLAVNLSRFPFPFGSPYTDLLVTHLPNALFINRTLIEWGQIPLWSNTILSGYPFAANPLSGLWYPPLWLAAIFPSAVTFNLLVIAHLVFGGIGLYRFVRKHQIGMIPALAAAYSFALMPKLIAHFASGHIGMLFAVAWIPWLLSTTFEKNIRNLILKSGLLLAIILIADTRMIIGAVILWGLLTIFSSKYFHKASKENVVHRLLLLLLPPFIGVLIAAPLLFPMMQYLQLSTRTNLTLSDNIYLSLNPVRLLGLFFPDFWGNAETTSYFGILPLFLLIISCSRFENHRQTRFWILSFLFSILLALGGYIPVLREIFRFPGFSWLRVPSRFLIFSGISISILAAFGLDFLLKGIHKLNRSIKRILFLFFIFLVFFSIGMGYMKGYLDLEFSWSTMIAIVFFLVLFLRPKIPNHMFSSFVITLMVFDFLGVNSSLISFKDSNLVLSPERLPELLVKQNDSYYRIYSPSYSMPQELAALYGFELADGVDPMQLGIYAQYMDGATGVKRKGYGVSVPPFNNGNPVEDNKNYLPDLDLLGKMNVKYVVSSFPIQLVGLTQISSKEGLRLYENLQYRPRAWLTDNQGKYDSRKVWNLNINPNQITLTCLGPGTLVLSEIYYPGWKVWVDGVQGKVELFEHILRAVNIPPGQHQVKFIFTPGLVIFGVIISVATLLCISYLLQREKGEQLS